MSLILSKPRLLYSTDKRLVLFHPESRLIIHPTRERCSECGRLKQSDFVDEEYFRILRKERNNLVLDSTEERDLEDLEEVTDPQISQEQHKGYYDTFFTELQKLGRGQRGSVYLVQHVLDSTPLGLFAVKAIPCGHSHEWTQKMLKEVTLLTRLRHRNIIGYRHAWLEDRQLNPFVPNVPCLFILMEYANGGDLESWICIQDKEDPLRLRKEKARTNSLYEDLHSLPTLKTCVSFSNEVNPEVYEKGGIGFLNGHKVRFLSSLEIKTMAIDISKGVEHLHNLGILHRDLKPSNLLLIWDDEEEKSRGSIPRIVISDFGECQTVDEHVSRTGFTGTLDYVAPELLTRDPQSQFIDHSESGDVWSLGLILYFLCFSKLPYTQSDDVDLLKSEIINFDASLVEMPKDKRVKPELRRLISDMLRRDADSRPTIQEVVQRLESLDQAEELDNISTLGSEVIRGTGNATTNGGMAGIWGSKSGEVDMLRESSQSRNMRIQEVEVDGMVLQRRTRRLSMSPMTEQQQVHSAVEILAPTLTYKIEMALQKCLEMFTSIKWLDYMIYSLPILPYILFGSPSLTTVFCFWITMIAAVTMKK